MKNLITTTTVIIIFSANIALGEAEVVWQIGKTDRDYRDLAFPGNFNKYQQAFPKDVNFVVGKSDPLKDFSAVHPGPADRWAGLRKHPFSIRFEMPAVTPGVYELQINLVDTNINAPPSLQASVNGKIAQKALARGAGERTILHPETGKARSISLVFGADHLKQGANLIELRIVEGSWLIYDSVILGKLPENAKPIVKVDAQQTIFFIKKDDQLKQELRISATGLLSNEPAQVNVYSGPNKLETFTLDKPSLGTVKGIIHLGSAEESRPLTIAVSAGAQIGKTEITQTPQKKWRIFSAPSTHTDIGYTDIQSRVVSLHNRNTSLALQLIQDFPLYHWNLESSWAAQVWLRDMPSYRHQELYEAARQKRISIESSYLNMLTGLCSAEELIRNMYYSARLHREYGIPFESHTITDAPSHVWTVPSILAGAGIRCVSFGINTTRAPLLKQEIHHQSPFWWEGPDGGRVLTWFSAGYAKAGAIGLKDGPERMRAMIETHLAWWNRRDDYPYDAILLHGAYSDNVRIGGDIANSLTEYSKRYAYPKVIMCANNDFAEYIVKNFADKIPVVRGCGGSWWEDGAASSAVETAICRVAHQDVITAETVWAAAVEKQKQIKFPQHLFDLVWDNILLYDEHTWGAHNSIREPDIDFVHRQFAVKAAYATDAAEKTQHLLDRGLQRLAARVDAPKGSLLVFNPAGRSQTGIVETEIPRGMIIKDDIEIIPQQVLHEDELKNVKVAFLAKDVPAVGYRTYRVGPKPANPPVHPQRFDGKVLENDYYRVIFDPATGGITSLTDKKLGKELVDQNSKYKLGQLIYAAGGEEQKGQTQRLCPDPAKIKFITPTESKIEVGANGSVFSSAKSIASINMFPRIELEVALYEHQPRIDFIYRLRKKLTYDKEALYIAFPFAGSNPQFRYEVGGGSVRPNQDHFPGACRDWFSVQRWVTVNTDDRAVAWTPIDTPLITLCDMTAGKWLDELGLTNGTIFAYVMNNYWFTNYKAGQDGNFTFRYSLTSGQSMNPTAASLFGESVVSPMRAVRIHTHRKDDRLPANKSLVQVEPQSVMISTVKRADDGKGLMVRVHETAGRDTNAILTIGFAGITRASRCDLVERIIEPIGLNNGTISLKVKASSLTTVRLE